MNRHKSLSFVSLIVKPCLFLTLFSIIILTWVSPVFADDVTFPAQVNLEFTPNTIPSGGTSVLTISIVNQNAFPLSLSNVPAALTNTLPTGVTFASPANAATTCTGSSVSTVGTTISLIGGTVPAKVGPNFGSCTVSVNVTSNVATTHINTIPANNLKATDPTGTLNITNQTPSSNNLLVSSIQPPSLSKSFAPNTRYVGQTTGLSITIRNTDLNYPLTQTSLTDNLPANIKIANSTVSSNGNCGPYTVTGPGGVPLAVDQTSFTINNASIPANTNCVVVVNVTSTVAGVYQNTIPANAITSQQAVTNSSAANAPINFQSIGMTKAFGVANFMVGGSTTMTITLQNPTGSPYTGVAFTDTLPNGLQVVSASATQCSGTVTAVAGTRDISLSGGTIPAGNFTTPGSCTVTAIITGTIAGSFTNTIDAGELETDTPGVTNVTAVTANITVYNAGEGIATRSKAFSPSTIEVGGISTLTISVRAPADTSLTGFFLSDALPVGLSVASTPTATKNANCQGGTFTPMAGDVLLTYTGGTIPANQTCTLSVRITSATKGTFINTISSANISNNEGRNISGSFSGTLTVSGITVTKAFYPTTVNINGISTLTITLQNTNTNYIEHVAFTDTLPAGLTVAPTPNVRTTCGIAADIITTNSVARTIAMDGGIIPAQVGSVPGVCTVDVDVIGLTSGAKNNSIAVFGVSGDIHGTSPVITINNPTAANATVTVATISINVVKGFSPGQVNRGSSSVMTVTLTNSTSAQLVGISFTDNLPQRAPGEGLLIANPTGASTGTCGGTLTAVSGGTSFTFSGGYLAPNSSCSVRVNITSNVEDGLTNIIDPGDVTTTNGATNPLEAAATLNNLPGASLQKLFVQNPILSGSGNTSLMRITIQNESNFDITGVGFLDTLPEGMSLSGVLNTSQCNGGTVAFDEGTRILSMSGATLDDEASCVVEMNVTAPAVGTYTNCLPPNALINDQGASTDQACDTLTVNQGIDPPGFTKSFSPDPVIANATSALTFSITNPNSSALAGLAFTDTLPSGLVVATPPNAVQCGGTVMAVVDTDSIAFSGGTLAASGSCTITVGVKGAVGGFYENTSGQITYTGGTGGTASDSLTVISPPAISKEFSPDEITRGAVSTLTFTITNPVANTVALAGVGFVDNFPTGVVVAPTPNASFSAGCGSPAFTPIAGASSITFSGGTIAVSPDNICTVSVDVTAPNGGIYNNISNAVTSTNGGPGNTASDTLTVNGVGLALLKTTTTSNFKIAGDPISYSYQITNTGTAPLYAPFTITDDKIGTLDCGSGGTVLSLAPTESTTCTGTYNVTAGDISARSVTNIASATAKDAETGGTDVQSNSSSVTVQLARISIDKSTTTSSFLIAGNRIDYNYILTNTGTVNLYAPFQVSDDHFGAGAPFACGSTTILPPGGNITCSKSGTGFGYLVTAADVTAGFVTNTAYGIAKDASTGGANVTSTTDSVTVNKMVAPSISKIFSPNPIAVGGTSTLTFTIVNPNLLNSLTGVSFSDNFPTGMTTVVTPPLSQCGGTITSTATSISLAGGSIIPDSFCTVSVLVTAANPKNYNNTSGSVGSTNGGSGNSASNTLTVITAPVISKSFSPVNILENGTSTMQFSITNPAGNTVPLTGVGFTDTFPAGLLVQHPPNITGSNCGTPTFTPSAGNTSLTFSGATIDVGQICTVTVDVTAPFGVYPNTTNSVTSGNGGTGVPSNTAVLTVDQAVDLVVTKTNGKVAKSPGDITSYTVEVTNTGPSTAVNARFVDVIPSSLTSATWTCAVDVPATCGGSGSGNIDDIVTIPAGKRVVYTITATVAAAASTNIVNNASAIPPAGMTDTNENNNTGQDQDGINKLSIDKTSAQSDFDTLNETINYSYTITNSGTSVLYAPFSVVDDRVTPTCDSILSLNPGGSFQCTANYLVTQADLDGGFITNRVTATGLDGDGDTVTSNTDELTISANQGPVIGIAKRVVKVEKVSAGTHDVTMEILVLNYGNVTLSDISIVDDLTTTFPLPTTFDVQSINSSTLSVNSGFNGDSDLELLGAGNTLDVGQSKIVTIVVRVIPTSNGPYTNTASTTGVSPDVTTVTDNSQNGTNPDPDTDHNPKNNNEPTPVDFGPRIFDPPYGIKTLNSSGVPVLRWTMVWINDSNIVDVAAIVRDPIPQFTTFSPGTVDSGYLVPGGAPDLSTSLGVSCTSSGTSTTSLCYYEGPTVDNIRGQIIWQGVLAPDFGVTDPTLAQNAITITFDVIVANSSIVNNIAYIDSDLNGDGDAMDINTGDPNTDERRVAQARYLWDVTPRGSPETGFAPDRTSILSEKTVDYKDLGNLSLSIPRIGIETPIIGVPETKGGWDVTWLGEDAGWLNGTAFPTFEGNSVITGHVYDSNGKPGPFNNLGKLRYGDKIYVQAYGFKYTYEVREVLTVKPDDLKAILKPEKFSWITLLTCKDYIEEKDSYASRLLVRSVLVKVEK